MMFSTSPRFVACSEASNTILCTGRLLEDNADSKSFLLQHRPLLKRAVIQTEEDSTDIGSAVSSDADLPCSTICTDDESMNVEDQDRLLLKQKHQRNRKLTKRTPLEPILGTPAGMTEHPPLFFPSESPEGSEIECSEAPKDQAVTPKADAFRRPPGLFSPQRSRKPLLSPPKTPQRSRKPPSLLATVPKLPSQAPVASPSRRNRKPKVASSQSVLATGPEHLLGQPHVLPPSPTKRVRSAIIDQAKREAAPLKVQMESQVQAELRENVLDPMQPVKKRLPDSVQGLPKLTPGMPAKKRVTPWLLEQPVRSMPEGPR